MKKLGDELDKIKNLFEIEGIKTEGLIDDEILEWVCKMKYWPGGNMTDVRQEVFDLLIFILARLNTLSKKQ